MTDISKIGERERLKAKPGDEPHWQRLRPGCFVGYRPSKRGGKGTWFARAYDVNLNKYARRALGDYGALTGNEVFIAAKRDAEAWADQVEGGGRIADKLITVADACRAYSNDRPGKIAAGVFRRHVFEDPIARVRLDKLRRHHLREWRKRLEATPALITRNKGGERLTKPRSGSTVNRDIVPLRAALGRVLAPGTPNTEAAWQEALKPLKGVGQRRGLYLDRDERKRLLANAESDILPFLHALCILPLRPGALAMLQAGDFEMRTRTLTVGKDKNGRPRKIAVPQGLSEFLHNQTLEKSAITPIFSRADGNPWNKDSWKHPVKNAARKAGLPATATAYTLRHSVITDLIRAKLPALTVAQISGTSVSMIEQHYGHLVREDAEEALSKLSLDQ